MLCICALLMQDYSLESFACSLDDMGILSTVGHPPGTPSFEYVPFNCCMSTLSLPFPHLCLQKDLLRVVLVMSCLLAVFLAFWQMCGMVPQVGYRARTPYAFILPASLFSYSDSMAASTANASPHWLRVQNSVPAPFPHTLNGSASFRSIHATANRDPVEFRFSFLTGILSISLLIFLSPCSACVLCFYCLWHSYLPLSVLFSLPPFPHAPAPLFTCNTSSFTRHYITQHEVTFVFPAFPCCPFL